MRDESTCRLCGRAVPKRKRQAFANTRQHLKHSCPHGTDCPTGSRLVLKSQTLTPHCPKCRAASPTTTEN